ncbi:coiled-coil domain-containing protein 138-like isoform X2 [Polypterus senegalus]|nr:coiled-coil domain-containing protein 138-like isoform X2 [Polypterus senegalus]
MSDEDSSSSLEVSLKRDNLRYASGGDAVFAVKPYRFGADGELSDTECWSEMKVVAPAIKPPTCGLSYSELKHYNKTLSDLFRIVRHNSDRLEKINNCIHTSVHTPNDELSEAETSPEVEQDMSTQLGTETEVVKVSGKRGHLKSEFRIMGEQGSAQQELKRVYEEMSAIRNKLQLESAAQQEFSLQLHEREQKLLLRESLVLKHEQALSKIKGVEEEVRTRIRIMKEQYDHDVQQLTQALKGQVKENKRLKSSFDTIKEVNDSMKKQLHELNEQNKKLESQAKKVQARLDNLQRKYEFSMAQKIRDSIPTAVQELKQPKQEKPQASHKTSKISANSNIYELLAILMDWISDSHLCNLKLEDESDNKEILALNTSPNNCMEEKCTKLLPILAEQLQQMAGVHIRLQIPLVKFIYWSLRQLDSKSRLTALVSTTRRLGEEVYKGTMSPAVLDEAPEQTANFKTKPAVYFKSPILHMRFLSTLIVLKTVSQADYLAQAFDTLLRDLKNNEGKSLFLEYQALNVVLKHAGSSCKRLPVSAMDVILQMTTESRLLNQFLEACSNEHFFRVMSLLLRNPKLEVELLEKASIILQKLSKMKKNKRLFEMFTLHLIIQEMHRTTDRDHAFLSINLTSILFNLGMIKQTSLEDDDL